MILLSSTAPNHPAVPFLHLHLFPGSVLLLYGVDTSRMSAVVIGFFLLSRMEKLLKISDQTNRPEKGAEVFAQAREPS
jgi:hypothetical protein